MRFLAWYCRQCRRLLKTEPEGVYPQGCSCRVPMLPTGPTAVTASARVYLHPALLARRAGEIARAQHGRIAADARGRPFVVGAEPLAEAACPPVAPAADELGEPMRFAWLIQKLCALRWPVRPSMGEARRT